MKVHILTIGDEILIGQVVDTNSAWMAQQLNLIGARVMRISTVGDDSSDIEAAVEKSLEEADVLLITGGLGPTKDDITKKALADLFGVALEFHQSTYDRIVKMFKKWGRQPTPAHRLQCFMPTNAQLLFNKMGTAPGMLFEHKGKVIVSMPGIPYEMEYLMKQEVIPALQAKFPGEPIVHRTILTVGEGESRIATRIEDIEDSLPPNIKLAFLPNLGQVRLRLSGTGSDLETLEKLLDEKVNEIKKRIPELIFGVERDLLEASIGNMLQSRELTIGTAESCTGGYLAHRITSVPGSSAYFLGSIIAYSNKMKRETLYVLPETLEKYGAVSEQTVVEMVRGALKTLKTDLAVATSGIAGPGGGTPDKPVGTIWIAVGNADSVRTLKIQAGKDRLKNIQYASVHALNLIRLFVLEQYQVSVP